MPPFVAFVVGVLAGVALVLFYGILATSDDPEDGH